MLLSHYYLLVTFDKANKYTFDAGIWPSFPFDTETSDITNTQYSNKLNLTGATYSDLKEIMATYAVVLRCQSGNFNEISMRHPNDALHTSYELGRSVILRTNAVALRRIRQDDVYLNQ